MKEAQFDFTLRMVFPGVVELVGGLRDGHRYNLENAMLAYQNVKSTPEQYATNEAYEKHVSIMTHIVGYLQYEARLQPRPGTGKGATENDKR